MLDTIYHRSLPHLDFGESSVLVVGDVMLDRYWQGSTERKSPEATVPVVRVSDQSMRIGGAGNVAVNITSLGAQAKLLSVYGMDAAGDDLFSLLKQYGVGDACVRSDRVETTTKLRILSQHQQLIRLDFETHSSAFDSQSVFENYNGLLDQSDLVVLSDYGKGIVTDAGRFISAASERGIRVLVDPKVRDFMVYQGAHLVTPNKKEFELAAGETNSQGHLEEKAANLIEQCELGGLLVTQGDKGMTLVMRGQTPVQFPTFAQEVFDVTGAGDTVIAALAVGLSSGLSVEDSVHMACVAAGIVVGRVGTSSVSREDLLRAEQLNTENLSNAKVSAESDLLAFVEQARLQDRRIVMTNGCFDLLHSGHVRYLEQAAQLGDILIVAVNSDDSVTRLKGDGRPINNLEERMSILAGLASVDKVVSFDQMTPQDLICKVRPDVLVKGGDYQVEEIAGRECAGEVRLIYFIEGRSTSQTVDRIRNST